MVAALASVSTCAKKDPPESDPDRVPLLIESLTPEQRVEAYVYLMDHHQLGATEQKKQIDEFFREADTDGDGDLTKEEFREWFEMRFSSRHPEPTDDEAEANAEPQAQPPTAEQLNAYSLRVALPFFGFGFIDNFLMIVFGESIDVALSSKFGMSMMFSAGLGNVFADSIGIMTGDMVDRMFHKADAKNNSPPPMTAEQQKLPAVTKRRMLFKIVGISSGCVAGMIPLVFL